MRLYRVLTFLVFAIPGSADDGITANAAIERQYRGVMSYRSVETGVERGEEHFSYTIFKDGSRLLRAEVNLHDKDALYSASLRLDSMFNPLEAWVQYWNGGKFKGSGHLNVFDGKIHASVNGPSGGEQKIIDIPAGFSLGLHPTAVDGFHVPGFDLEKGGTQTAPVYNMNFYAANDGSILGWQHEQERTLLGRKEITVPAGTFEVLHFEIDGAQIWITPKDRMMVKMLLPERGYEYVLEELDINE